MIEMGTSFVYIKDLPINILYIPTKKYPSIKHRLALQERNKITAISPTAHCCNFKRKIVFSFLRQHYYEAAGAVIVVEP